MGPPSSPYLELNAPTHTVVAGQRALVSGHSWFPNLTCTAPVKLTLEDSAGKRHRLGTVIPISGGVSIDSASVVLFNVVLAGLGGSVRIPEEAAPGRARLSGDQTLRFKFLIPPCLDVATQRRSGARVEVLPAVIDTRVIANVAVASTPRGTPARLTWTLLRAGRVRVVFDYVFSAGKTLSISTPLNAQRPAGANALDIPTVLAGQPLPAGGYRVRVELFDAQGSTAIPAAPKTTSFRVTE